MVVRPRRLSLPLDRLIWPRHTDIGNETEWREYFVENRLRSPLESRGVNPCVFALAASVTIYLVGVLVSYWYGVQDEFLREPLPLLYAFEFAAFGMTWVWVEESLAHSITDIDDAFDEPTEYYRVIGGLVERFYEPFPHVSRPDGRWLHRPVTLGVFLGVAGSVVIIESGLSQQIDSSTIFSEVPALHAYLLVLHAGGVVVTVLVGWIFCNVLYYLGYRVGDLSVTIDITQNTDNLGFRPDGRAVLKAILVYLGAITITALLIVSTPSPVFALLFSIHTLILITIFIGCQYGIHRAIRASKRERLEAIREEYAEEISQWFSTRTLDGSSSVEEINTVVTVKREIEDAPEWPTNLSNFLQVVTGAVLSNVTVIASVLF